MVQAPNLWLRRFCMVIGCCVADASMDTGLVRVAFELIESSLKIMRIPVTDLVQILATDGSNEPFHVGM